jgi:NAD(P)-dependent dehydrogenase (short-subunit alcohol dehydrogenase family)/pimeloyl-ACP methyl ester carboxylesterase
MRVLQGKRALITGAASGIGRAIALALAAERCHVYLLDIDDAGAAETAGLARRNGVEAISARCDLADPAQISTSIQQVLERWPAIDILVNSAGVAYYGPTENMTAAQWDWLLKINLLAPIQFTRELLPTLLAQPEGHVLNVCSIAGLVAGGRAAAYQVSKFGLVGFTEALRSEYVRRGVGLTALCPGPVRTNMYRSAISGRPNKPVPVPPAWACATPEQVARKAIRGIRKNSSVVLVTPMAYALSYIKRLSPGLLDWLNCLGRKKRSPAVAMAPSLRLADLPSPGVAMATQSQSENRRGLSPFVAGTVAATGTFRQGWSAEQKGTVPLSAGGSRTGAKTIADRLHFDCGGMHCEALLMRPARREESTPLVIMAHGFAAEKSFGLSPYAEQFVRRGMAVMLFDYRHFGGSGGVPRNLVSHWRQREDWQAALDFAGRLPGIDSARIALWGTSFSGGHVLDCASRNPSVAAIVAQMPMLDVPASLRGYSLRYLRQAVWHGLRDLARAATFRSPHRVPVVGSAPAFAVMNKPGCESGYRRLVSDEAAWANSCPARVLLTSLLNRPIKRAARVQCPALFVVAGQDQLAPARAVRKAAARMADATVVSLPGDHFAPYFDETFEEAVRCEADFLERCLVNAVTLPISERREKKVEPREQHLSPRLRVA